MLVKSTFLRVFSKSLDIKKVVVILQPTVDKLQSEMGI